jgi:hypothetical protein
MSLRPMPRIGLTFAALALAGVLLAALPADAQQKYSDLDIKLQLERGLRYLKLAASQMEDPNLSIDTAWRAYVEFRAAHAKIQTMSGYPNSNLLFPMADENLKVIRDNVLVARAAMKHATVAGGYQAQYSEGTAGSVAMQTMQEAIRRTELVLNTVF